MSGPSRRASAFIAALSLLALSSAALAQSDAPANSGPNPYRSAGNWLKMPQGPAWGSAAGVDIDPGGKSVWALGRCGANSCAGSMETRLAMRM